MTAWDHRAGTGNGAYQIYLYVNETEFINAGPGPSTGVGVTRVNIEIGLIKVGSSGGFRSNDGSVPWWINADGYNSGSTGGTGAFDFAGSAAIGTRQAIGSVIGWTFSHNPQYNGSLGLRSYGGIDTDTSIGDPGIDSGWVGMTSFVRNAEVPAVPVVISRDSDTQLTMRAYNSTEWGLGNTAVVHSLARAESSNMAVGKVDTTFPNTGGGSANTVVQSGLTPHKTYYFTDGVLARSGSWAVSGVLTVHARPSKPAAPEVSSKTTTSLNLTTAAPSYVGGGLTARETQISLDNFASVLQTSTHLTAPTFSGLTRVQPYKARTRVQNAEGWSDWSDVASTPTPGTPPSAPTSYAAYDIAATSAKITLGTISDNGGAVPTQARVKISTTQSDAGLVKTVTLPSWSPVRITGLNEATQYYAAEGAFNNVEGGGWGAYGAWVPLLTLGNVPNAPVLSLDSAAATFATLKWTAPTDLNGATIANYKLRVGSNEALTTNVQEFTIPAGTLTQVVTGLNNATNYWAEVWTETDRGRGSGSDILAFATTGGGGSTSGIWLDFGSGMVFCEVWFSGNDGVPKLSEPWHSGNDGVPKLCGV
ncbi:minor tail protein [Microbacterium phage Zhengyi]|nr:minor tail protein [Microbacterium phage Zhengyi]